MKPTEYTLKRGDIERFLYQAFKAAIHYDDWYIVLSVNAAELAALATGARWALDHGWDGTVTGEEQERGE